LLDPAACADSAAAEPTQSARLQLVRVRIIAQSGGRRTVFLAAIRCERV